MTANNNTSDDSYKLRKSTKGEKVAYAFGDVGCNFIWTFASSFLVLYYTDSAGVSAAFVGTMMLVSRILDGVSDIAMGVVLEKTNTRWGKARPWLLFGCIPFALSLVLVMNVPAGFSDTPKKVYIFITYIFMAVICYTAVNLAYHALLPRFSFDSQDRNNASSIRMFFVVIVALAINMVTPSLLAKFGGEKSQKAWTIISAIYAILAIICLLITFFFVKERVPMGNDSNKGKKNKIPLKDAAQSIFKNKYFYITLGLFLVMYIGSGLGGLGIYFARDVLGDASLYGLLIMATTLPMMIAQFILPALFKKFGKRNVCMFFALISILSGIVIRSNPYSFQIVLFGFFLKGVGSSALATVIFTFSADVVDYGEAKTNIRAEGLAYSATSFGMKVGTGLGSAILGWSLSLGKYNASLDVQTPQTVQTIINVQTISTILVGIFLFLLLWLWDYDKKSA